MPADKLISVSTDDLYHHGYDGFRPDPLFAQWCAGFVAIELSRRAPKAASLLDVGCGNGEFLKAAAEAGFDAEGFDVSPAAAEFCRSRGLVAHTGDFSTVGLNRRFDVITLWDVLEHLPDPARTLSRVFTRLVPGGLVFVKTPSTGPVSLALARALPTLEGPVLQLPAHIQFFSRSSLERTLLSAGFAALEWLPSMVTRSPSVGGPVRKRFARLVVRGIHAASGDGNLLVFARTPT